MTLAPNALTTIATLADELNLGSPAAAESARLERMINVASAAIEEFIDRKLARATYIEKLAGSGTLRLVVPNTPLVSVTSILDDTETVDDDTYEIDNADAGIVIGLSMWRRPNLTIGIAQDPVPGTGRKNLTVTYVGGYYLPAHALRDLPYDLEQACLITAASLYRGRGRDRSIASEGVGDASVTYGGVNTAIGRGEGGIIPDDAVQILKPYRRVVMA